LVYGAITVWAVALAAGWWSLEVYDFGTNASLPSGFVDRWPDDSALVRHDGRPTMLLFLHPKCPCSRASLGELERLFSSIAGHTTSAPDLIVVATVPQAAPADWYHTDTVARALRLSNARLYIDREGVEAARFGATTSGSVMLFDPAGARQYAGGVTIARGHEGGNAGRDAIAQILRGARHVATGIPAFGCRLCLPGEHGDSVVAALGSPTG
jgi:hypothetical protein